MRVYKIERDVKIINCNMFLVRLDCKFQVVLTEDCANVFLDVLNLSLGVLLNAVKPVFHQANLFARTDKKVGTLPTCSRRIFSPANSNQSRCRILVFASRRTSKFA